MGVEVREMRCSDYKCPGICPKCITREQYESLLPESRALPAHQTFGCIKFHELNQTLQENYARRVDAAHENKP